MAKVITATDPNGNTVKSSWPQEFTDNFSAYFDLEDEVPQVNQTGQQQLNQNHLWLQVLDENGEVILAHNTSDQQATHYAPMDILALYQGEESTAETIFANQVTTSGGEWTYLIGFPMNIAKVTMFVDGDSFSGGKSLVIPLMTAAGLLMLVIGGVFGVWIIRHMGKLTQAIGQISYRLYEPIEGNGPFQDVYDSLNEMNSELQKGDRELAQNEKMRKEWITNITHDLKTPLSPIRGYGELLADPDNDLTPEKRVQYGEIILRNTAYTEKLVNDLKLTYQLKNKMLPLDKKSANLTQFVKELVIEVLNHHEYANREITFETDSEAIEFSFDPTLLKRGINNLLYNALIHNPQETAIQVSLQMSDGIRIIIQDNGKGMTPEESDRLFERYYRGTNTEANTGGTGLGMAIAKQIIEIHDGTLVVGSAPGKGTRIIIIFPT
ncbi:HAMP domain-containing histidine kinase [Enterococcus sp. 669A]|uniref:histidine kinase n=1 Tax=Candidatus Enterococcus moelleringii TaxID=2815325 RepID=A0ABS3LDH6_9ENTE|nr:HAMP domain-containing sensor histidine kinase [Enterococcus sp. 669A]MBO1307692.1 HAMP domain-containing histidine kinase [Enterococcus sp. 669A]